MARPLRVQNLLDRGSSEGQNWSIPLIGRLRCAIFLFSKIRGEDTFIQALFFDVRKGTHSIGSNVRDAACYFFWAIARTHDIEMIKPYSSTLAHSLVTLALFDREIHIRRAASAAFQENVGRMVNCLNLS
jgi:hypothetical protein